MKSIKIRNMVTKSSAAIVAVIFFVNSVITDYAYSLQVPSQVGSMVLREAANSLYGLSMLKRKIEEASESCGSIGDFYFSIALKLADIAHCKIDLLVRKNGRDVAPQEIEGQLAGLTPAERIQRVNAIVDEILIRLSNGDIILRYWNSAAKVPDLDNAISVGEHLQMRGETKNLVWDTYYTNDFVDRIKTMVGTREVEEVAEELARPLLPPERVPPAVPGLREWRGPSSELTIWLIKALNVSIVPVVALVAVVGYKLWTGDTAGHEDYIGPSADVGPVLLAVLLGQVRIRFTAIREWFTGKGRQPGEGYQRRRLAVEKLEGRELLSTITPVDLSADLKSDNMPVLVGPLTAGEGVGAQPTTIPGSADRAVTVLYSEGEAVSGAESGPHSEWQVTKDGITTYLSLDFRQFSVSWSGNTHVYLRDLDMVGSETSQDAGFVFSRRGYGKFDHAIFAMERNLRFIGENGLADQLVSGALYNQDYERREWHKTVGTTTTFLTLDARQFTISWNGNTFVYLRDLDMVGSETSQDAGFVFSRREYGKFDHAIFAMERNLRFIGEDDLADQLVSGALYNQDTTRREWHKTVGTTTTYLTLDSKQFVVSWSGNTHVYLRDLDMVGSETSQDAGFVFSRRGYGKFDHAIFAMERNLRFIGENGLADQLVSGALYNYYQQVSTPVPGTTIQIDAERSIYFSSYNGWRITESATNRISDIINLDGRMTHYEVPDTGPTTRIFYDKDGTYIRGNIDGRAFEYGFDRFNDYVNELFRIRGLLYSWRDEIAKDAKRADIVKLLDNAIVDFYNRMPAQRLAAYYYAKGSAIVVRTLANGEIQRPADPRYYQGSLEGRQYWFDSIRPESVTSDGSRVTAKVIEVGIGQSLPPVFPWEEDLLTPETGFNGIMRPNDDELREYLIRLDRVMELLYRLQRNVSHVVKPAPEKILNEFEDLRQRVYEAFGKAGIALPDAASYTPDMENEYTIYRPNGDLETWVVQKVVLQEGITYRFRLIRNEGRISPDVNRDGFVTPIDALIVINFINKYGTETRVPTPNPEKNGFVDVNEDTFITPIDVLQVINYINGQTPDGEAAAQLSAQALSEGQAYISEIDKHVRLSIGAAEGEAGSGASGQTKMRAKWDGKKEQIVVDVSAGPEDEQIATAFITRPSVPEESRHPLPMRAKKTDEKDSVAMTREAAKRLQADGKTEATTAMIIGTLALILDERELEEAEARGLPFREGTKPDAERLKTIFRREPADNPVLVKVPIEALENLTPDEISKRFGPYREIGNLHIRLFSMQAPGDLITERAVYEKYALAESFDKSCPITDETSSKENTITLWCAKTDIDRALLQRDEYARLTGSVVLSIGRNDPAADTDDPSGIMRGIYFGARGVQIARYVKMELGGRQDVSYKDLTEPDIREYIDKTVHEYRSWLYVFGLCDMDELNRIGPQLFIDIATSINVNKVFRALKLLIKLTPITPFDIAALRRLRDKLELLEAAA